MDDGPARVSLMRKSWLSIVVAPALAIGVVAGCGEVDTRPAQWDYISPALFQPNCATSSCHGPAAAVSGLDFSTPERGYLSLRGLWTWVVVAPDAGAPPAGTPCATVKGTFDGRARRTRWWRARVRCHDHPRPQAAQAQVATLRGREVEPRDRGGRPVTARGRAVGLKERRRDVVPLGGSGVDLAA